MKLSVKIANIVNITKKDIQSIEGFLGYNLPKECLEFFKCFNGGDLDAHFPMTISDVECKISLGSIHSIVEGQDNVMSSFELTCRAFESISYKKFLPLIDTIAGDSFLYELRDGTIWYLDHEKNELEGLEEASKSLNHFLNCFKNNIEDDIEILVERFLIKHHLSNNTINLIKKHGMYDEGESILCSTAAKLGYMEVVKECVAASLPVGDSVLSAGVNGHWDIIKYLMSTGEDINQIQFDGRTLLDWLDWKPDLSCANLVKELGGKKSSELTS